MEYVNMIGAFCGAACMWRSLHYKFNRIDALLLTIGILLMFVK